MKKIINGKRYDTETAKRLASENNGLSVNDFRFCDETLYRKKTGEYFIHGDGGAMTEYSHTCSDGSICGGEDIKPISEKQARVWVEEHANEAYESIFGECEEV